MEYIGNIQVLFSRIGSFMLEILILLALYCLAAILLNLLFKISRNRKFDRFFRLALIILPILLITIYLQYFHLYKFEEPDIKQLTYNVKTYKNEVQYSVLNTEQSEVVNRIIQEGYYKQSYEPLYSYQPLMNQIEVSIYNTDNPKDVLYLVFNDKEMNVAYSPELKCQLIVEIDVEELHRFLISEFKL